MLPALALAANQHVITDPGIVEHHFVEVTFSRHVHHGPHRDALAGQIDQHLAQTAVARIGLAAGANQRDHRVRAIRERRPQLASIDAPATGFAARASAHRGEIRAGAGFAEADAKEMLAARDRRQEASALLLRSKAQQQRPTLAIRNPVRRDGRPGRQQLLEHHVTLERTALLSAVALWPHHADPAAPPQLAAEPGVEPHPGLRPLHRRSRRKFGAEKRTNVFA